MADMISDDLIAQYVYITSGLIAMLTSTIVILVILCRSNFRRSYVLFLNLAMSDFTNGLGYMIFGLNKLSEIQSGFYYTFIQAYKCTWEPDFFLHTLGVQWPRIATLLLSVERLLALQTPVWFRNQWTSVMTAAISLSAFVFCVISTAFAVATAYNRGDVNVSATCTTGIAAGVGYSAYHYGLIVTTGTLSLLLSLITVKLVSHQIAKIRNKILEMPGNIYFNIAENKRLKSQKRLVLTVTVVSLLDFVLTVVPNCNSLLLSTKIASWPLGSLSAWMLRVIYCLNSALTPITIVCINPEFRSVLSQTFAHTFKAFFALFQVNKNSVKPMGRENNRSTIMPH